MLDARGLVIVFGLALGASACGGDDSSSGGGTGGASGSGGAVGGSGGGATGGTSGAGGGTGGASGSGGAGGGSGTGGSAGSGGAPCFDAKRLWFEDFETGDYSRWTSKTYDKNWNNGFCHDNGFSTAQANSPTHSHRSEITCADTQSHRGYGGLQFAGDSVVPAYTNQGSGIDAPNGVVNTYWSWLEAPYAFQNGKWFSFWTVNNDCGWKDNVITLGLEDTSNKLTPAHIKNTGGTVTFAPNAPGFPMGKWVRTTIYINYHEGVMVTWQDGTKVFEATFSRPDNDICQWHWGAYASGDNDDVVLYEDDNSIWKLGQKWTNFDVEPYFGVTQAVCSP
ncbi:MAG: hypothetical protein HS104_31065 [Polyangiaceae bacterium]|nr:hypothetical protein [Polyangiaceae bacterium]